MPDSNLKRLTSGRVLARNTIYNFLGQGAPLLVSLVAFPLVIKGLGTDRFGILTLAWIILDYFSLFDLGLGRAITQVVAEKMGAGQEKEVPTLLWTASLIMLCMGFVGTIGLSLLSPWLVGNVLKIPDVLQHEALIAFYLLALSIPVVTGTSGLVGFLAALQRFDLINAVRIPMGLFMFVAPLLVLPFSKSLALVMLVSVASRVLALLICLKLCLHAMPTLKLGSRFQKTLLKPLFRFGGWMTVTNVVGPLMVNLDRFLIGSFISVTAVAYYATPYTMATKLWIVPGALLSVLFPAFSTTFAQDPSRTAQLSNRGIKYIFLVLFPITLIVATFAHEGLYLWLGNEFAQNSTSVLQWLIVGVFINCLAQVPFALIQGIGRPDLTAKLHLIEIPFYLLALWWLVTNYGITGAAVAWVLRVSLDMVLLYAVSWSFLPGNTLVSNKTAGITGITILVLVFAAVSQGLVLKTVFLMSTLLIFCVVTWIWILDNNERHSMKKRLNLSSFH